MTSEKPSSFTLHPQKLLESGILTLGVPEDGLGAGGGGIVTPPPCEAGGALENWGFSVVRAGCARELLGLTPGLDDVKVQLLNTVKPIYKTSSKSASS